jgi:LAGLIDADG-like domain
MMVYMSPNRHLVQPDRETLERLASEMSNREIGRLYGCAGTTVARWRDQYGMPRSTGDVIPRPDRETFEPLALAMNNRQIGRMYGCASTVIAKWRDFYGLPRSPRQSGGNTTRWQTNRAYFDVIDTPEKAYILGFLIADGHVRKGGYGIQVSVKESDGDLLRAIAREIGCDAPLTTTVNHYDGSRMTRLSFYGKNLVARLNALGLYHDKSKTAVYPVISPELERHLVRGLWDGDGYIGGRGFGLMGTPALLDGVGAAIERHTGRVLRRKLGGRDRKYHYLTGSGRDTPAVRWMYSGATIVLPRKLEAARTFCYGVLDPAYIVSEPSS